MKLSDFDFRLPEELIAREPIEPRDVAKMMVLRRKNGEIEDEFFYNLHKHLEESDVLVLNNTRVFPARLHGKAKSRTFEIVLLNYKKESRCLVKPGRAVKDSLEVGFGEGLFGKIERQGDEFKITFNVGGEELHERIEKIGRLPLPPYILKERKRHHQAEYKKKDNDDYQTVFAKEEGSAASPTAGLHFTKELIQRIKEKGIEIAEVTLHVGLGTFEPIRNENFENHKLHSENYFVSKETAEILNKAKEEGRRIIAVGTTTTRVLESVFSSRHSRAGGNPDSKSKFIAGHGSTDIFIYPGYKFQAIDGMITNFHLPKSSLLLLVSAFAGKDFILRAYNEAIKKSYRFYSYGDGMVIL